MLESNDGELILDPEVDGIESSAILSNKCGFVEMFIDLFLSSPSEMLYIIVDELFGLEHDGHIHVSSLLPRLLYSLVDIRMQSRCVHWSQSSHAMDCVLQALWQIVQGNLGRLGPGFCSMPLNNSCINICLLRSLATVTVGVVVHVFDLILMLFIQ